MPVYSIILPIYNVERYLPECLDSVLAQDTTSSYEVILVDDGSPDHSGRICDEYAARHSQVRVLHKKNGGVSAARNDGLANARGDYVLFVDPDDICQPNMLSVLDSQREGAPDMVVFAAESFDEHGNLRAIAPAVFPQGERGTAYLERVSQLGKLPPVGMCNYIYRRDFLLRNGLSFRTDLIVAEDFDFNFSCLSLAEKVDGTEKTLYRYRIHGASVSQNPDPKKVYQKAVVCAKWFRRYPTAALANPYCYFAFDICRLGTRAELSDLLQHYQENADILKAVTSRKCKFARLLFRLFGYYDASRVIMFLIRLRHRVLGIHSSI